MTGPRRIGILGGTFDPVHCGHLDVGAAAQAALGLEEILVLPSNIPPHRPQPVASSYHRFAMVALAIPGRPGWRALDLELREDGPSYTSDTLHRLHNRGFTARELFFVTGADAFLEIATWKNYPAVLDLAHFAVVSRPGVPVGTLPAHLPALADRMQLLRDSGPAGRSKDRPLHESGVGHALQGVPDVPMPTTGTLIFLIDAPTADVSGTAIRRARARRQPITGLIPPAVRQHIEQHALYEEDVTPAAAGSGS